MKSITKAQLVSKVIHLHTRSAAKHNMPAVASSWGNCYMRAALLLCTRPQLVAIIQHGTSWNHPIK